MPMPALREKFASFASPPKEIRKIRGYDFKFYGLSPGLLFEMRCVATPVLQGLATIFADTKQDRPERYKEIVNPLVLDLSGEQVVAAAGDAPPLAQDRSAPGTPTKIAAGKGVYVQKSVETVTSAVDTDTIRLRDKMRRDSIDETLKAVTNDEARGLYARCILDSLKDDFPEMRGSKTPDREAAAKAFLEDKDMDAETLKDFVVGMVMANKGLFGPFGVQIAEMVRTGGGLLMDKLVSAIAVKPSDTDETNGKKTEPEQKTKQETAPASS